MLFTALSLTTAVISQEATLAPSLSFTTTDVNCFDESTGSIDIIVSGGQAPYTFQWSNGAQTQNLTNLSAGTYSVLVTDVNGLTHSRNISVKQPAEPLQMIVSKTDITSIGANDGTISVEIEGGTPFKWTNIPYIYIWSNEATSLNQTDLSEGTYVIMVEDYNGCSVTKRIRLEVLTSIVEYADFNFASNNDVYYEKQVENNVFPNPSYGEVSLVYDSKLITDVVLIPINGKNANIIKASSSNYTNLNNLSPGYYEIRFMNGNTLVESKKIVVY